MRLLFAAYSQSLRVCEACQTTHWCKFYDRLGLLELERQEIARWEDEGGRSAAEPF